MGPFHFCSDHGQFLLDGLTIFFHKNSFSIAKSSYLIENHCKTFNCALEAAQGPSPQHLALYKYCSILVKSEMLRWAPPHLTSPVSSPIPLLLISSSWMTSTTHATVTDMDQEVDHQVQCPIHSNVRLSAQSSCRSQRGLERNKREILSHFLL